MRFFIRKFLNPETFGLADQYVKWEVLKSQLEEQRPEVYERVLELQEATLAGKPNAKALDEAQKALVDVDQKVKASDRAMVRLLKEIPAALGRDIDGHYRNLSQLQDDLSQRRSQAARRVHLAQEITAFFQGSDPSNLEAVSGKLNSLQAELDKVKADPESLDYEDLAQMVAFIEKTWASGFVRQATTMRELISQPMGDEGKRRQEREGNLAEFQRQLIRQAREKAGVEPPAPPEVKKSPGDDQPNWRRLHKEAKNG
jgi:hypothetical protein